MRQTFLTLLLCGYICLAACKEQGMKSTDGPAANQSATVKKAQIQLLDVHKTKQLTEINHQLVILDVRTPAEYHEGHLNNAQNVNFYGRFEQKMNQLDKDKPYLVYCQRGGRSNSAAKMMIKAGFSKVYDMQGGFTQWSAEGLPFKK